MVEVPVVVQVLVVSSGSRRVGVEGERRGRGSRARVELWYRCVFSMRPAGTSGLAM